MMKNIKFRCSRCGYTIEIPEKTESVLCGNCAKWNKIRRLFPVLNIQDSDKNETGLILQKIPGSIFTENPLPTGAEGKKDQTAPDAAPVNRPGLLSMLTLLFLIMPVISIVVTKLKLPPFTTFIILAAFIFIYEIMKKRS